MFSSSHRLVQLAHQQHHMMLRPAHQQQQQQQQQRPRRHTALAPPPAAGAAGRGSGSSSKRRQSPVSVGLCTVLKDELKIEKERYRTPEAVLEGPPGGYELEDRPNCTVLLLTREFGDEEIVVEVDIDAQAEADEEDEGDEVGGGDDEGDDADALPPVSFSVNISKGDRIMAFACETDGDEVFINHVSLTDAPEMGGGGGDDEEDDGLEGFAPYTGPVFSELDDTLQQAFADYLEERGINGAFGAYLVELVHDKLEVEYMNWLGRARQFIDQ